MILSGDEFANSQNGNNNPYCQDNATTWLNWNDKNKNSELFEYTKQLIQIKKMHPILRRQQEFRIMDTLACGFPDLSYHGEEVWQPELENHSRQIAMMFCGLYASTNRIHDDFFYLAINMHWIPHTFALPRLPDGDEWVLLINTESEEKISTKSNEQTVTDTVKVKSNLIDVFFHCNS